MLDILLKAGRIDTMNEFFRPSNIEITSRQSYLLTQENTDRDKVQISIQNQTPERAQFSMTFQEMAARQEASEPHDLMDQSLFPPLLLIDLATLDQTDATIWIGQQLFHHGGRTRGEATKIAEQWLEDGKTLKTATMTRLMVAFGNEDCFCVDACRSRTKGIVRREPWEHLGVLNHKHSYA